MSEILTEQQYNELVRQREKLKSDYDAYLKMGNRTKASLVAEALAQIRQSLKMAHKAKHQMKV